MFLKSGVVRHSVRHQELAEGRRCTNRCAELVLQRNKAPRESSSSDSTPICRLRCSLGIEAPTRNLP